MMIPYELRLICVCLASFAIVFGVAGFVVSWFVPAALRAAARMPSDAAARLTLGLRMFPAALAMVIVAAICVPSYLRYEQRAEQEDVGVLCLALAAFTAALFLGSLVRTVRAWRRSSEARPVLALTGLFKARIVISDAARHVLTDGQLAMAIRHEQAHARSSDNLKRLFIHLAPGTFPRAASLEQAWKRFAEWAADDSAAAGDPQRAISLAEALVRVAKLGTSGESALMTSFLASENDLEARVDRLLNPGQASAQLNGLMTVAALASSALLVVALMSPATVHELLERLIH